MSEVGDRLMKARCRLMTRCPWYGHMAMSIEWSRNDMSYIDDPKKRKIGMFIDSRGIVHAHWNPEWAEQADLRKMYGTVQHTIDHLVRLHTLRRGSREGGAWDLACDMAVNGSKSSPNVGYQEEDGKIILPEDDMVFVPDGWEVGDTAENYYTRLMHEMEQSGQGQGEGQEGEGQEGEGQEGEGQEGEDSRGTNGYYEYGGHKGKAVDAHEPWDKSQISEDEARQIMKSMTDKATEKSQGDVPGHLQSMLETLSKPKVRWRELLRNHIGRHVGGRRKTFSRVDRRTQRFGFKGISHHAAATVSIIVDTSGSIGQQELQQFFAEIEAVTYKAKANVLQWDASFQGFKRYRKNDWRSITINGRGGTDMAAPVEWLEENGAVGDLMIMLTDGYCNWPEPRKFPAIFVITTSETDEPGWGVPVRMQID